MKLKPKRGRPALPEGTTKNQILRVKVSPAESALIDSLAVRHGVIRSEIVRRAIYMLAMYPTLLPAKPLRAPARSTVVTAKDFELLYGDVPEGKKK